MSTSAVSTSAVAAGAAAIPGVDGLLFEAESHTYTVRGQRVPSVTQVLRAAGLMTWLDRIPPDVLEEAQARGTRVHTGVERILRGKFDWGRDADEFEQRGELGYLSGLLRFLDESGFEVDAKRIEHMFHNSLHGYAGRLDFEGLTGTREEAVVDVKSGGFEASARLQLAAYLFREAKGNTDEVKRKRRIVLQLRRDGTYRATPLRVEENRQDFQTFLGALRVAVFKQLHGVK